MPESALDIRPVAPAIGAEIRGVDLGQPLGNRLYQEIHDALMRHLVLFFPGQDIDPADHVAFSRRFGELHVHPFYPHLPGHREVMILESDETYSLRNDVWHSDVSFIERPPMGSVLRAIELPAMGGDTLWSNMYAAYDELSKPMRKMLAGLTAVHDYAMSFEPVDFRDPAEGEKALAAARKDNPPVEHPVIRTHPVTGRKCLYVNSSFTSHIVGMTASESRALLDFLYAHVGRPEFTCRHRWAKNDIAFWDNRCTQHYALSDYFPARRVMQRTTIIGDRPA